MRLKNMTDYDHSHFKDHKAETWTPYKKEIITSSKSSNGDDIVILSYNILCDNVSMRGGYHYIPKEFLPCKARVPLILKEVAALSPSVVGFQEVGRDVFHEDLVPGMKALGFEGMLACDNPADQNVAFFYKSADFELKHFESLLLEDLAMEDILRRGPKLSTEEMAGLKVKVTNNYNTIFARLSYHGPQTALQGKLLNFGVVHLVWDELKMPFTKAVLALSTLNHLVEFSKSDDYFLFGDFNMRPDDPAYEVVAKGKFAEITDQYVTSQSKSDFEVLGNHFTHSFDVTSSYVKIQGKEPLVTADCDDVWGPCSFCADYIWYNSNPKSSFEPYAILEVPSPDKIKAFYSLPSIWFPSDHLPICTWFTLKR